MIGKSLDKEYLGITGLPAFTKAAAELAFDASNPMLSESRVCMTFFSINILVAKHVFIKIDKLLARYCTRSFGYWLLNNWWIFSGMVV